MSGNIGANPVCA